MSERISIESQLSKGRGATAPATPKSSTTADAKKKRLLVLAGVAVVLGLLVLVVDPFGLRGSSGDEQEAATADTAGSDKPGTNAPANDLRSQPWNAAGDQPPNRLNRAINDGK